MQSSSHNALKSLLRGASSLRIHQDRHISLTGAIEKGIRHAQQAVEAKRSGRDSEISGRARGRKAYGGDDNQSWNRDRPSEGRHRTTDESFETSAAPVRRPRWEVTSSNTAPLSISYTQADSEFIYGTFAVKAAIAARRRMLHKLYVYVSDTTKARSDCAIQDEAKRAGLDIKQVSGQSWLHLIEKASQGRPHNGYLLEASPLPIQNVVGGLKPIPTTLLDTTDGAKTSQNSTMARRFPFYLFLDLILDPGNLGAIVRSAYFFGVDGVILPEHNTAPLTGVAVKASAGAAEYLPLLRVKNEVAFIQKSRANGWRFYGAAATMGESARPRNDELAVADALDKHPTVLVLGGEAEGIRPRIARALDQTVSIGTSAVHPGIDSLNVSVAASILMRDFLKPCPKNSLFR